MSREHLINLPCCVEELRDALRGIDASTIVDWGQGSFCDRLVLLGSVKVEDDTNDIFRCVKCGKSLVKEDSIEWDKSGSRTRYICLDCKNEELEELEEEYKGETENVTNGMPEEDAESSVRHRNRAGY